MRNTWFTSDEHIGHQNIIPYCSRPWTDVDHMREGLIANFNARVQPGDFTWHLGDFSLHARYVPQVLPRLNGEHGLIMGNHDALHPCRRQSQAKLNTLREFYVWAGFTTIAEQDRIEIAGQDVLMAHMPYQGDHTAVERYKEYRPKDEGRWLLHGHVHNLWKIRGKQINVGVDVWDQTPVHMDEIAAIIRGAQG